MLLTSHDLDEVERLADHVVILDHGGWWPPARPASLTTAPVDEVRFGAPAGLDVAALAAHLGAPVEVAGDGEYLVRAAGTPGAGRRAHRVAGRARPPARPTCAPAASGSRTCSSASSRDDDEADRRREGRSPPTCAWSWRCSPATASRCCSPSASRCCCWCSSPTSTCCPIEGDPIDFLAPGVLALAILSTAFVNLAIGVGFEREYGVLKRLGATPLGRPRLLGAKTLALVAVEVVQVAVLWPLALALGWDPSPELGVRRSPWCSARSPSPASGCAWPARCAALVVLAAANGLYLVLLLLSGMVIPLDELPGRRRAPSPGPCRAPRWPRWCAARSPAPTSPGRRVGACSPCGPIAAPVPRHPPLPLGVTATVDGTLHSDR